jgi:hypothetical protein
VGRWSLGIPYLGDGWCVTDTWSSLSGRGVRRARPEARRQEDGLRLRQRVCEGGARYEARGQARRSVVGSERECRIQARQVLDGLSRNRAWPSAVAGKQTRTRPCLGFTTDIEGSLVALLQGLSRPSPSCPRHLGAQTREGKGRANGGVARVNEVWGRSAGMEWSTTVVGCRLG